MVSPYKYTPQELEDIRRAEREVQAEEAAQAAPALRFTGPSAVGEDALRAQLEAERASRQAQEEGEADLRFRRANPQPEIDREGFSEFVESAGGPARVPAFKGFQQKTAPDAEGRATGIPGTDTGRMASSDFQKALNYDPYAGGDEDIGSVFRGIGVGAPRIQGPQYSYSQELDKAYQTQLGGVDRVSGALRELQDPTTARGRQRAEVFSNVEKAKGAFAEDEKARMTRQRDLTKKADDLQAEAERIAGLKIDPEAMLGRGGARSATIFSLGIANVLGNIGQAMQGKAATNQVLGIVRDMIAQDIGVQQEQRKFELQGLAARESALGRMAGALKDERAGADALLAGQLKFYESQLSNIQRNLTDAEAWNVVENAKGKIQEARGNVLQGLLTKTEEGQYDARKAQAGLDLQAGIANTNVRIAEATSRAQRATTRGEITDKEMAFIGDKITKRADEKRLSERAELLRELREYAQDPANRNAIGGLTDFAAALKESVGRDSSAGALRRTIADAVWSTTDPRVRRGVDLLRRYTAIKESGQGGKAVTGIEDFLYKPGTVFDAPGMLGMIEAEHRGNITERDQLFRIGSRVLSPNGRNRAAQALNDYYPDTLPEAPNAPAEAGPTRNTK